MDGFRGLVQCIFSRSNHVRGTCISLTLSHCRSRRSRLRRCLRRCHVCWQPNSAEALRGRDCGQHNDHPYRYHQQRLHKWQRELLRRGLLIATAFVRMRREVSRAQPIKRAVLSHLRQPEAQNRSDRRCRKLPKRQRQHVGLSPTEVPAVALEALVIAIRNQRTRNFLLSASFTKG